MRKNTFSPRVWCHYADSTSKRLLNPSTALPILNIAIASIQAEKTGDGGQLADCLIDWAERNTGCRRNFCQVP